MESTMVGGSQSGGVDLSLLKQVPIETQDSALDLLKIYDPSRNEHVTTAVTRAEFEKLGQATPMGLEQVVGTAKTILDGAGIPRTGLSSEAMVKLASSEKVLASPNEAMRKMIGLIARHDLELALAIADHPALFSQEPGLGLAKEILRQCGDQPGAAAAIVSGLLKLGEYQFDSFGKMLLPLMAAPNFLPSHVAAFLSLLEKDSMSCDRLAKVYLKAPAEVRERLVSTAGMLSGQQMQEMLSGCESASPEKFSEIIAKHQANALISDPLRAVGLDFVEVIGQKSYLENGFQARVIARFVVGEDGLLDRTLVKALLDRLGPSKMGEIPSHTQLRRILLQIDESERFRDTLLSMDPPDPKTNPGGDEIVRASLGLPLDVPIRPVDARRAALAGLLTDLRQFEVGSCFGTSIAIRQLQRNPEAVLRDFKSLIEEGCLKREQTRPGGKMTLSVPINTSSSRGIFLHKFLLDTNGDVLGIDREGKTEKFTWGRRLAGFPELEAVGRSWGLTDSELDQAVRDALKSLDDSRPTLGMVLREMTRRRAGLENFEVPNPHASPWSLNERQAKFLKLLGATENVALGTGGSRLLRSWEYTISTMAERGMSGILKTAILQSLFQNLGKGDTEGRTGLFAQLIEEKEGDSPETYQEHMAGAELMHRFGELFNERMQFQYDASIEGTKLSSDGKSSRGGFQLIDTATGLKVDTREAFNKTMEELLRAAAKQVQSHPQIAEKIAERISTGYIQTGDLAAFSTVSLSESEITPWNIRTGDGTSEILRVYFEREVLEPTELLQGSKEEPIGGQKLAEWILGIARAQRGALEKCGSDLQSFTLPMTGGPHAFLLTPGHPSLLSLGAREGSVEALIQTHIVLPSRGRAVLSLDSDRVDRIIDAWKPLAEPITIKPGTDSQVRTWEQMKKDLLAEAFPEGKKKISLDELQQLIFKHVEDRPNLRSSLGIAVDSVVPPSVPQQEVDRVLREVGRANNVESGNIEKAISKFKEDLGMVRQVPQEYLSRFISSQWDMSVDRAEKFVLEAAPSARMIIGDTNWGDPNNHFYFCLAHNPITDDVELWIVNQAGQTIESLDSKEWLTHSWEVHTHLPDFGESA
jgi:hypothetical protein